MQCFKTLQEIHLLQGYKVLHSLKKKTLELPVRNGQWFHVDSLGVFLKLWKIKWKILVSCNEVTANGEEVGMKAQGVLKPWNIETMG